MLTFRASLFQYFLSVSPQEGLGSGDLNRCILEAKSRGFHGGLMLVHTVILTASALSRKACTRPKKGVPALLPKANSCVTDKACLWANVGAIGCDATVSRPTNKRCGWQDAGQ
jgi:hypothetical protein